MVIEKSLDRVFRALAHPARRAMLQRLATGERNLSELAAPLRMTFPAASKHVRVLEAARLVEREVRGRDHLCHLVVAPLDDAARWAQACRATWEANFARLDALLEEMKVAAAVERRSTQRARPRDVPAPPRRRRPSPTRRTRQSPRAIGARP